MAPHYARADDEGRTLLHAAFASAADQEVTTTELRVTLAPQSSAHRTRAIAALCAALDGAAVTFPGTKLSVRYAVAEGSAAERLCQEVWNLANGDEPRRSGGAPGRPSWAGGAQARLD